MDKNAIKKYAVWARTELIDRVSQKAFQYGITEKDSIPASATSVNGVVLSSEEMAQRKALLDRIAKKGYKQVMEEVAYTWFNRFSALRFMEVNGYLPSRVRVFTDENNQFDPQIIAEAIDLEMDGLDMEKVYAFKDANDKEGLFKYLIIVQCNALSPIMPGMFQRIADYTELLFPDNLLREGSAVQRMIEWIPEEDWKDAVQIIGWLYQYYNTDIKDEIDRVQGTKKISKHQIPAATQVFTPDWIVRYMVENSLGRLWIKGHPDETLRSDWTYYLDEAEQEPEVKAQLEKIRKEYAGITPEQIKCIDPCSGSGHICAYMFDVLMQIYEAYGYTAREAVRSIVENNIYGLDIDERAAQLAYFSVMMKARQYDRRYLTRKDEDGKPDVPQPRVYEIIESNGLDRSAIDHFIGGDPVIKKAINSLITEMHDAKEYGSILNITPVDFDALYSRFDEVLSEPSIFNMAIENDLLPFVKVAETMSKKYDVVVTNPPYMGSRLLNDNLRQFLANNYSIAKTDTYAAFVLKCLDFRKPNGYVGMMTPNTWLTINSYKKLREHIVANNYLSSMILLSSEAFNDAGVVINSFVLCNDSSRTSFCDLQEYDEERLATEFAQLSSPNINHRNSSAFLKLPNTVIDPSFSDNMICVISENPNVHTVMKSDGQTKTGDNDKYLRMLWEVDRRDIGSEEQRWCLHAKGGGYRKWYGNVDTVIDWSLEARMFYRKDHVARITPEYLWYKEGITWSLISGQHNSFRLLPEKYTFNCAAPTVFFSDTRKEYFVLGLLNTNFSQLLLKKFNATINLTIDDIGSIPYINTPSTERDVVRLVEDCIAISKSDWDAFETSYDFVCHPIVTLSRDLWDATAVGASMHYYYGDHPKVSCPLELCYMLWQGECNERFKQLKENEEELNRIFIDIYGLQDELTPEVQDKDVTVRKADLSRDIRSFISYAVGCIFGRYSLDVPGLAYAGGEWDDSKYTTFRADKDNILPISDDDYFKDDIVGLFVKFVERVYGRDTLEANLRFIADALGGKGAPRDVIRSYFLNDFYADHLKIYQKRPIYWLFDSGKKNGFKALVYMHRYQPDIIARMRTDYVHEQQARYRTAIADLEQRIASASTSERVKLSKRLKTLQDQAAEIQAYEEKIHHLADQYISIDLDDGVKVNYAKFQDVLAKIK